MYSVEHPNNYYSNTDEIELQLAMPVRIICTCIAITQQAALQRGFSSNCACS